MNSELTAQAKAAKVTYLLSQGEMRTSELMEALGYKQQQGVSFLMRHLSAARVPVHQPRRGWWAIRSDEDDGMSPQARAATAVVLLSENERVSNHQLMDALQFEHRQSIVTLMDNLSFGGVPVFQPETGYWSIIKD